MRYTVEHRDNIVILTINNTKLNHEISANFKAEILIIAQPDIDALIIDMSNVEAIDSSGLSALLLAHRQLVEQNTPIVLCGVQEFVRMIMGISQIDHLFHFFDTIDEAFDSFEDDEIEA